MCKISTKIIKLYVSWSSIFKTKYLVSQKQKSLVYILVWDFALLNKYYQIIKKKEETVHVSQFYINHLHLRHLNVWLVSDQGPLELELRNLPLSYVELRSGDNLFTPILLSPVEGSLKIFRTVGWGIENSKT